MKTATNSISDKLAALKAGEYVDVSLSNGVVRSSKEVFAVWTDQTADEPYCYTVFHGIDGTTTDFTLKGIIEVFEGKRSAWDGDLIEEDE